MIGKRIPFRDIHFDGWVEVNFQLIIIRQQIGFYIDLPLTEHIIGCQYLFFVQVDICIGIQSFEYESDSLFLHDFCRERKSGFIDPVFFVDPLQPSFVESEERIFNDFISQQIGMYHTRYGSRIPVGKSCLFEFPAFIQFLPERDGHQ